MLRYVLRSIYLFFYGLFRLLVLRPLSWIFMSVSWFRGLMYSVGLLKSRKMPVTVISVGNISTGGTGKTPMAEMLIRILTEKGIQPAYLSRGYGRKTKGFRAVNPQTDDIETVGDESLMVAHKFPDVPVAVCEKRTEGVEKLLQTGRLPNAKRIDVVILDDAFQHRAIARDFDLVMLDGNRPPWKDYFLPYGRLRESLSALKRADLIVVNKIFEEDVIRGFERRIHQKIAFTKTLPLQLVPFFPENFPVLEPGMKNKRVCVLFSGVGNNEHFSLQIRSLGIIVMRNFRFSDHHFYRKGEIERVTRRYKRLVAEQHVTDRPLIITTEKDYFRLRKMSWFNDSFKDIPFYYLTIRLEIIRGKDTFEGCIEEFLRKAEHSI